jgi:serine/threonine protein kinase/Flp pilus assembly protein TadD
MQEQSTDDGTLFDLLVRWEELRMGGREIPPDVVCHCAGFPELAHELERQIAKLRALEPPMGPETEHDAETPDRSTGVSQGNVPAHSRYQWLRLHARGGLGEVHVALDEELRREVAIKELQAERAKSPANQARFLREAEITGSLGHPGIVPVYGLGRQGDGQLFYATRLVRGESLGVALRRFHATEFAEIGSREMELRKLLRRFLDVCNAVAYAHSRGVIHRDIKPENIMLGPFGETLVVDWGVAKVLRKDEGRRMRDEKDENVSILHSSLILHPSSMTFETLPGSVVGTPSFMSPEQTEGLDHRLGPASDIYSLGATLYTMLTGKPPFEATERTSVLERIKRGQLARPRELDRRVHPALEAICLRAMALQPQDRYASARALAEDIDRWLADEPVTAWHEPWAYRARRWIKRHRGVSESIKLDAEKARADDELLDDLATARANRVLGGVDSSEEYRSWFGRSQLRVDVDDPVISAAALSDRPARVTVQIASYLDDWSVILRSPGGASDRADRLTVLARALHADPWRNALRDALSISEETKRQEAVAKLLDAPDATSQPSSTIALLSRALRWTGRADAALNLMQTARFRCYADPWIHQELGLGLLWCRPPRREDALRAFTAATTLRPEMGHTLAVKLRETGRTDEAVAILEDLLRRKKYAWYLIELGEIKADMGRLAESSDLYRQAEALCRRALEKTPDDFTATHHLADALKGLGDRAGAAAAYHKAPRLAPNSPMAHNNHGNFLLGSGDLAGAMAELREAMRLDPRHFLPHRNLGIALTRAGDAAAGIAELRKAGELGLDPADMHHQIGWAFSKLGDHASAVPELREATRLRPDFATAYYALGVALCNFGDPTASFEPLRTAKRLGCDPAWVHYQIGRGSRDTGDLSAAIAELNEAIRLDPKLADAHNYLGMVLRDSGNLTAAVAKHRDALHLNPDLSEGHNLLAIALHDSGDRAAAIAELREAIRLAPEWPSANNNLGCYLKEAGDLSGAISAYHDAIRRDPHDPLYFCNLATALRDSGRLREALDTIERGHAVAARRPHGQKRTGGLLGEIRRDPRLLAAPAIESPHPVFAP